MKSITVRELADLAEKTVIDVREPHEYVEGHVPGAVNVPLSELPARLGEIPTDRPIQVICELGGRSARATQAFAAEGLDATNVTGGTSAWVEAQLPVER
jgi:rhodanese-related sulfurtransferase